MKVEFNNLQKIYKGHAAVASLTMQVPQCQTLVIVGPSGGGKSTLLRLMAGLELPTAGSITFNEQTLSHSEINLLEHRRRLGIVFQSWNLFPHLSALENIVLPLYRVHGFSNEEAHERAQTLLRRFDLATHGHKHPYSLSGGQKQRVALIRAVAHQPKTLMLDEPTSALDPLMTIEVLELILELKNENKDIALVTHHLPFARRMADQVLFMANGELLEHGPVENVFSNPQSALGQRYMSRVLAF